MTRMPQAQVKIAQISKDLNIKTKDIIDTFKELGIEKKVGGSADLDEYELFLDGITKAHQIKDLDAYRSGKVKIASQKQETAEKKPEPKPEPKVEQKAEAPVQKPQKPERQAAPAERKPEMRQEQKPRQEQRQDQRPRQDSFNKDKNRDNRPQYQKYSAAPQENPFAKKHDSMNRAAQGFKGQGARPDQQRRDQQRPQQGAPMQNAQKPEMQTQKPQTTVAPAP